MYKIDDKMLFVAAYVRVSTEEQKLHGLSVADQESAISQWANNEGLNIVRFYNDAGYSARKPYNKRPAMVQLIEDIKLKKVNLVVFTRLDRWFRSISEYYKVQSILDEYNVSWRAILEDYETVTASGRLKVNIMLSVAQDEADRTSERIKFTFEQKRARGESTNGRCPLGYKIINGRPEIDPDTSEAALDMFRTFVATRSALAATKRLQSAWGISRDVKNVRLLLKNRVYIGEFLDVGCPALIPNNVWDQVQAIRASRGPRSPKYGTHTFLFQGLIRCAECGCSMSASAINPRGTKEYVYYRCQYTALGRCNHKRRVREGDLESWLLDNLIAIAEVHNIHLLRKQKPKKAINTGKIRAKMEKLKDLYLSDLIDRDMYEKDYLTLKQELETAQKEEPQEAPINIDGIKTGLSVYENLDKAGKKEFWSRTLKRIVVNKDGDFFVDLI